MNVFLLHGLPGCGFAMGAGILFLSPRGASHGRKQINALVDDGWNVL